MDGNNDDLHYEDRFVCFVDILGFSDFIIGSVEGDQGNAEKVGKIKNALDCIKHFNDNKSKDLPQLIKDTGFRFTQFSDCFIMSSPVASSTGLFTHLLQLVWTQAAMIRYGFIIRGGIALGKAIHTDRYVFGPAVVTAVNNEKLAKFPRIIVDDNTLEVAARNSRWNKVSDERKYLHNLTQVDDDGLRYVDYFYAPNSEFDSEYDYPIYLFELKDVIVNGLLHPDERVKLKYEWMKTKYNTLLAGFKIDHLTDEALFEGMSIVINNPI